MSEEKTIASTNTSLRNPPRTMLVIPCYNEEPGLRTTAETLRRQLQGLIDIHEIDERSTVLFVDDGSKDATWVVINALHAEDPQLFHGIKLAHNKGHQNALFAGLMHALHANADAAISMDADLQDDPGAIDGMVEAYREGAEIVYGVRDNRDTDTAFKRGTAHMFYGLMKGLGTETVPDHADYRLMSHEALAALSQYRESNLFLRGLIPSLGFTTAKVYYKRGERVAGESKYPLRKMVSFAVQGITSFSTKPLNLITDTGLVSVLAGIAMLIYILVTVCTDNAVSGWASIMCSLWIPGGTHPSSLGHRRGVYCQNLYRSQSTPPLHH